MTDHASEYDRYHSGPDAPPILDIIARHLYWGWVVYDSDAAEGVEAIFATEAEAIAYRTEHHSAGDDHDADHIELVMVFPMMFFRGQDHEERPGRKLSPEEIAVLGPCCHLLDDQLSPSTSTDTATSET